MMILSASVLVAVPAFVLCRCGRFLSERFLAEPGVVVWTVGEVCFVVGMLGFEEWSGSVGDVGELLGLDTQGPGQGPSGDEAVLVGT